MESTMEKIYSCQICQEEFSLMTYFYKHFMSSHGNVKGDWNPAESIGSKSSKTDDNDEKEAHKTKIEVSDSASGSKQRRKSAKKLKETAPMLDNEDSDVNQELLAILAEKDELHNFLVLPNNEDGYEDLVNGTKEVNDSTIPQKANEANKKCTFCGKSYGTPSHLKTHISEVHYGEKKHKCNSCEQSFTRPGALKKHINLAHKLNSMNPKKFKCKKCGNSFTKRNFLTAHISELHKGQGRSSQKCDSCGKSFKTQNILKKHVISVHKDTENSQKPQKIKCDMCEFICDELSLLENHITSVHLKPGNEELINHDHNNTNKNDEIIFQTPTKQDNFMSSLSLSPTASSDSGYVKDDIDSCEQPEVRQMTGSTKEIESADHVQKSFEDYSNFSQIENTTINPDVPKCNSCDKSFSSGQLLKFHIKNVHEARYKCEFCEKGYMQKFMLRNHIKKDHKESKNKIIKEGSNSIIDNDFLIEQAKKNKLIIKLHRINESDHKNLPKIASSDSSDVKIHITDNNTKETENDLKQKSLEDSNTNLAIENVVQEGINIRKCNSCDKSFSSGQILKKHAKKLHDKNIMFKCESCEKSYAQTNYLSNHMRSHKGSKNKKIKKGANSINNDFLIEQAKRNKAIVKLQRIEYNNLASEWIPLATLKILKAASRHRATSNVFEANDTLEFSPLANLETKHHVQNPKRRRKNSNSDLEFASRSKMSRHTATNEQVLNRSSSVKKEQISIKQEIPTKFSKNIDIGIKEEGKILSNIQTEKFETKVKITIDSTTEKFMVKIRHKNPNDICLSDLKKVMPISGNFRYFFKNIDEDEEIIFEERDYDQDILPLFQNQIIVKCKSLQ